MVSERLGYVVAVFDHMASNKWAIDWDGELHTELESAQDEQVLAQGAGWVAVVCQVTPIENNPLDIENGEHSD